MCSSWREGGGVGKRAKEKNMERIIRMGNRVREFWPNFLSSSMNNINSYINLASGVTAKSSGLALIPRWKGPGSCRPTCSKEGNIVD